MIEFLYLPLIFVVSLVAISGAAIVVIVAFETVLKMKSK